MRALLLGLLLLGVAAQGSSSLDLSPPPPLSPRLTKLRTLISGGKFGAGCDVQDPSPMVRDPQTDLWHFWSVFGCGGTCGWAGHLRHWYSNSTELATAGFLDGGIALNHSSDPHSLDSNGQFSPGIFYDDEDDATWYLFFSATGKNGSATRSCVTEPTGCTSSQMVASSSSPHGPWRKLGAVARALNDGSWNERLVDSGRALQVQGKRGFYGIGFVSAAREHAGHVEDVEGVYRTRPACLPACSLPRPACSFCAGLRADALLTVGLDAQTRSTLHRSSHRITRVCR